MARPEFEQTRQFQYRILLPEDGILKSQLADDLRTHIQDGVFLPGSSLPSYKELAQGYGVKPSTAKNALHILVKEGFVVTRKGYRATVTDDLSRAAVTPPKEPTKTQYLVEQLLLEIQGGTYNTGDKLPTQHELIEKYGVSRTTVSNALKILAERGITRTHKTLGTFVCDPPEPENDLERERDEPPDLYPHNTLIQAEASLYEENAEDCWLKMMSRRGGNPTEEVDVYTTKPTQKMRVLLEMTDSGSVIVNERLRTVDGRAYDRTISTFPETIVDELDIRDTLDIGPFAHRVMGEITARMPKEDEIDLFQLQPEVPLLVSTRTSYDADDRPLRVREQVIPADRGLIFHS